jgi:putative endopeptidase
MNVTIKNKNTSIPLKRNTSKTLKRNMIPLKRNTTPLKRNTTPLKRNMIPLKPIEPIESNTKCTDLFSPFEKKVEMELRNNNIDLASINYNLEEQVLSDLKSAVSPSNIKPENDFYSYVNDRWLITQKEADYGSFIQFDNFRITQFNVNKQLIGLYNKYCETHNTDKSQNMKKLLTSLHRLSDNMESLESCNNFLKTFDTYAVKKENMYKFLGFLNTNPIVSWGSPLVWNVVTNEERPEYLISNVSSPVFTLLNYEMYFPEIVKKNKSYQKYIEHYLTYLTKIFENVFGKNHQFNVNDIYACESEMMSMFGCDNFKNKTGQFVTKQDAKLKYNFDWEQFTKELGYKTAPDKFYVTNINYFYCITKLLKDDWNTKKWRTYFLFIYLRNEQRFNITGQRINMDFQYTFAKGGEVVPDYEIMRISGIVYCYNNLLNNMYIEAESNPLIINYVTALSLDLKEVFIRIIKRNVWMQPLTKKYALEKLDNFAFKIGSITIKEEDPNITYNETGGFMNLTKMANWRVKHLISKDGTKGIPPSTVDWSQFPPKFVGNQSFIVNAMYTPTQNKIDIPLGYLQMPFLDLKQRGVEYNLANIGFTIGHEMSHALDDQGSQYDKNGKRTDWWDPKDKEQFKIIQTNVIKQYEVFASYDGLKFDASPSIGENLADISGIAICLEYLRDFQLLNKYILPIQTLSFTTFFVYYAYHQRQIVSKKAIQAQLVTNPHPLSKYRTNVPLTRMQVFRELYQITKKNKMWWDSTNKVWTD